MGLSRLLAHASRRGACRWRAGASVSYSNVRQGLHAKVFSSSASPPPPGSAAGESAVIEARWRDR
jgi:hypothetical protein